MFGFSFLRRPRRVAGLPALVLPALLLPVLIGLNAGPAFAQQTGTPPANRQAPDTRPADSKATDSKAWDIRLGAGALVKPDYEGSDDYEVAPLPLLSVNYRDIVLLDKTTTLGANVFTLRGPGPNDKMQ